MSGTDAANGELDEQEKPMGFETTSPQKCPNGHEVRLVIACVPWMRRVKVRCEHNWHDVSGEEPKRDYVCGAEFEIELPELI